MKGGIQVHEARKKDVEKHVFPLIAMSAEENENLSFDQKLGLANAHQKSKEKLAIIEAKHKPIFW